MNRYSIIFHIIFKNIPLYGYTTIYLAIDQCLNFFHIRNIVALNISAQISVLIYVFIFMVIYLEIELPDHVVTACLTSCGTAKQFSTAASLFTFLQAMYEVSFSPYSHQQVFIVHLFYYSHHNCEMVLHSCLFL